MAEAAGSCSYQTVRLEKNSALDNPTQEQGLHLMKRSQYFYCCHLLTGKFEDIHQAIHHALHSLSLLQPYGAPLDLHFNLGKIFLRRFQLTRQDEDITNAITLFQHGVNVLPTDEPWRQVCVDFLCLSFLVRDGNLDALPELNALNASSQSSVSLETLEENLRDEASMYLDCTMLDLQIRYASKREMQDLDALIQLVQHARKFFASDSKICKIQIALGRFLMWRYDRLYELQDIIEAGECCAAGLGSMLANHANSTFLSIASEIYRKRFEALGQPNDLDNAVHLAKQAVDLVEKHIPNYAQNSAFASLWDTLGETMVLRYHTMGDASDLDAAVDALNHALDIVKEDDAELPKVLTNLGHIVRVRYGRSCRAEDLIESIDLTQRAANCLPPTDPRLIGVLANLSGLELMRSLRLRDGKWVYRAIQHFWQAWSIRNEHPELCHEVQYDLLNSTVAVIDFFRIPSGFRPVGRTVNDIINKATAQNVIENGKLADVEDIAIDLARKGASAEHLSSALDSYNFLCRGLLARWQSKHAAEDIEEAISTARRMIELADAKFQTEFSASARINLGDYLLHRSRATTINAAEQEEALKLLREGSRMSAATPIDRISAGIMAMEILQDRSDWKGARTLLREMIDLFEILNGRSQDWAEKQHWLQLISYRAATFAAITLEAGSNVLEVIDTLERCRGTVLGHMIDKQNDLQALREAAPELAQRFRALQIESDTKSDPLTSANTRVKQTTRRIKAEAEIRACLKDIRALEGFQGFLLGPTEEELKAAAGRGPIVIVNVTSVRSDVIIITRDAIVHVPLMELRGEELVEYVDADITVFNTENCGRKNKKFRAMQEWLWEVCVKIIFQKLKDLGYGPAKFRVWWIGVGATRFVPFHAAGKYSGNSSENTLSRAISSYAPTLKVLLHSFQKLKNYRLAQDMQGLTVTPQEHRAKPRMTVVTMPSTPGMNDLEGVKQEAEDIHRIVGEKFSTQILVKPSAKDTLAHMAKSEIVHFSCHGESASPDASNSRLLLQTPTTSGSNVQTVDELTLRDVAATDLRHGTLAVLSACSTAESHGRHLGDEVLHLVSGFQVAGYLHAIGNLWVADDQTSVEVVRGFYEHLVAAGELGKGENVARALNEALLDVAKRHARLPLDWAQFVHFGV